ncbi:uncharacterized protein LOC124939026 [Impatiens glandulifera]|uniref:uncharacterized protein LOC124939026 n=1 Tax=Impatiens glandulifera TaxID=253017 RepID=UPI001FB0F3D3|nr:uncharacterized protein LOC124939026 [Impatiens glandulifera]
MGHHSTQCREKKNEVEHLTHADNVEPTFLNAILEEIPPINIVMLNEMKLATETQGDKNNETSIGVWFLDNKAYNHMTCDKEKFFEQDEAVTGKVKFGDGSTIQIFGKCFIIFECKNGNQWFIDGVFYIPSLQSNLVSLRQPTETGHMVVMDEEELKVFAKNPSCIIMKVRRIHNRLYQVCLKLAKSVSLLANLKDPSWLRHARLGHVNFQALKSLVNKGMTTGVPQISPPKQLCRIFLVAKQTGQPFALKTKFRVFLNGELEKEVYMTQPEGLKVIRNGNMLTVISPA